MPIVVPPAIPALGIAPSTLDPVNFDARMDALLAQLPGNVTAQNTANAATYANALESQAQAVAAAVSAANALTSQNTAATSANAAATSAGAATWANTGATYAIGDIRKSPSNARLYRRLTASNAGTTDPAVDVTNWAIWSLDPIWVKKTANYTAIAGDSILADTTAGTWTLTLPAAPNANDVVRLADYIGTFALNKIIVGRNDNKINGLAEDMDIVNAWLPETKFTFVDATVGWRTL